MSEPSSTSSTDPGPDSGPDRLEVERLEVGRIARAHGLRGELVVDPISNRPERFVAGNRLYLDGRPVVIQTARPHQGRWLVTIDGVADRSAAEALRGVVVTGDPLGPLPAEEFWAHDVIGRTLIDARSGTAVGSIVALQPNPAHDLLVLDDGRLVPTVFVREITADTVVVDPPAGLLD